MCIVIHGPHLLLSILQLGLTRPLEDFCRRIRNKEKEDLCFKMSVISSLSPTEWQSGGTAFLPGRTGSYTIQQYITFMDAFPQDLYLLSNCLLGIFYVRLM